jgi:uncharacterized membrane protein
LLKALNITLTTVLEKVSTLMRRFKTSIMNPKRIGPYAFLVVISALTYGIVFSYFTVLRHDSFFSAAWDLGNFNQAFYTTVYGGKLFYYTSDLFFSPSGSIFAIHISPILFLVLPFYAIYPSPVTLLVVKSFAVGLAAIPLYLVTRDILESSRAGFLVALVYLLYPPLQGANWFDFQQAAFLPLLLFLMYFFLMKKRWKLYIPTMLLALMVEEHVALIVSIFAVYYFLTSSSVRLLPKSLKEFRMNEGTVSILTIAICAVYLLTAMLIKSSFPVNPDFADVYGATENFRILGSSDVFSIPIQALLNPLNAFDALMYEYGLKFLYIILLFGPVLFIPLRNRFVFGILFLLMPFLLSNYRPYYQVGVHYPFYVLPLIIVAVVYGLRRLDINARKFNFKTMIVVTLVFTISTSPLSPFSRAFVAQGSLSYSPVEFSLDQNQKSLDDLIQLLPSDASVLTQNLVFPHVSSRMNAYAIPFSDFGKTAEMNDYLDSLLSDSEYVLLEMGTSYEMVKTVLDKIIHDKSYGACALGSQAVLFKKGYHDEPINAYYTEDRIFEAYRDLFIVSPPGVIVEDSSSSSGKVVVYPKNSSGYSIFGPYSYLLEGAYEATFTLKAGEHDIGYLGTLDVASDMGTEILSFRDVWGFELKPGEWTNFTVPFSLPVLSTEMEFRFLITGASDIYLDRVLVKRISSVATTSYNQKTIRTRDLKLKSGSITEEGLLMHPSGVTSETFWYGPYWSFAPGNYSATFALKITPPPQEAGEQVLTLSISGHTEEATPLTVINERVLRTQDFFAGNNASDWHSYTVCFTVETPLIDVEFRGLFPSADYDIYLAFITFNGLN